jgi:hypothetical protein
MVSISDNAETWADGDLITEDERKLYTYMVIRRDLSTKLFTLNNGKSLQREYLIKLSRITFTTSDNDMGTDTPDDPVPDDPNPDDPDGGDG